MPSAIDTGRVLAAVDERRLLELERKSIRIPSTTFQEGEIADFYANYLSEIGLEVEMMEVIHPVDPALKSRQPIGRLEGHRRRADAHAQRSHGPGLRDARLERRSLWRQVRGRLDLGHGRPRRQGRRGGRHLRGRGHRALRHTSQGRRARHAGDRPQVSAAPARARFSSTASRPTCASTWSIPTTPLPTSASASSWCASSARRPTCSSATAPRRAPPSWAPSSSKWPSCSGSARASRPSRPVAR